MEFNRREAIYRLDEDMMYKFEGTLGALEMRRILNMGHVPFDDRTDEELKKLLDKLNN